MNNDDHIARVSDWFKGHPVRIGILVAGVIAVILLVAFNQQIGGLLDLIGSKAATGVRVITVNGENPIPGGYNFFSDGWEGEPVGAECFTTTNAENRLMLNRACPQPKVTTLSPNRGLAEDTVRIYGTGFTTGTTVRVGEKDAAIVGEISSTAITITIPSQEPGETVTEFVVHVNALGGASDSTKTFTYVPVPQISFINPEIGSNDTEVTIEGLRFGSTPGTVSFGEFPAEIISWTEGVPRDIIVVKAPAGTGTVRVIVTNSDDVPSPDGPEDEFEYSDL